MSETEEKNTDLKAIGKRIELVRGERRKGAFADYLGYNPSTLKRYEAGERPPESDFLLSLYFAEDIDPFWVLTGEGTMKREGSSKSFAQMDAVELGVQAQALFAAISELDDSRRFALLVLVLGHDAATAIFKPHGINNLTDSNNLTDTIVELLMKARGNITASQMEPHLGCPLEQAISTKPDAVAELLGISFERFAIAQKHVAKTPSLLENAQQLLNYIESIDMDGLVESKPQIKAIHETLRKNNKVQRASKSANHN